MNYIKGKIRTIIYESSSNYKVGIIRIKETNDEEVKDFLNKTITFVGYFADLNQEDNYLLYGSLVYNDKYGYQYKVDSYEKEEITGIDATIEFLSSPLIKGVGDKTAIKIVETLGEDTLKLIKEDYNNLLLVPGITLKKAQKIYDSIMQYSSTDDMIVDLKKKGFTINESLVIINKYGNKSLDVVNENPYVLKEIIDFKKIDNIYLNYDNRNNDIRNKACILYTMSLLEINTGNTYYIAEEIIDALKDNFKILITLEEFNLYLEELVNNKDIIKKEERLFLKATYENEEEIVNKLLYINSQPSKEIKLFDTEIIKLQEELDVTYNEEQLMAIKSALENRVSIITGGPGTGKTTIVKAITKLYIKLHNLEGHEVSSKIALLAPTGRASKKLAEATTLGASTIHRFLKWNKETNDFGVNEYNPNLHKLIIVDETSMIDNNLFASLLRGIISNVQLVLVGDANQLPSVGPGLILNDLINSQKFTFTPLNKIYRQSNDSFIPFLASEIKNRTIAANLEEAHDDYNFLQVSSNQIKMYIKKICEKSIEKGLTDKDIQVLIPMYKGENGIDNINILLQGIFNPKDEDKKEIRVGEVIYRVGDKVLQLVNDPDNNIFNGDIGYIEDIMTINHPRKQDIFIINYDGIKVEYKKEDMNQVKHAYAITIHKSQGSEFKHVIMPISKNYYKMLYNKLIYTGVSRAKKSLVIIGEKEALIMAINNIFSENRKTDLYEKLVYNND